MGGLATLITSVAVVSAGIPAMLAFAKQNLDVLRASLKIRTQNESFRAS